MKKRDFKRVVILVIDGLGVGALPDAALYGDAGSHTLDNISKTVGGLRLKNLSSFGLGLVEGVETVEKAPSPEASFGRMREASPGKDTSTGHWEMAGIILKRPFRTYPDGFPPELLEKFTRETGYGHLWGLPASGTEIIDRFGEEHMRTRNLIVYTSADSVFQIAAHEEVVPVKELYRVCALTRGLLNGYDINRVIARPFKGRPGGFKRTERRKDFSVEPPEGMLLDLVKDKGIPAIGIGKIGDIFCHRGLAEEIHIKDDMDGMDKTIDAVKRFKGRKALIFTNIVDLDTKFGHRNDVEGSARALVSIDERIPELTGLLTSDDIFIVTGDHGCDPTTPSTDHSREYAPLIVYGKGLKRGVDLGTRKTFADLGATVAEAMGAPRLPAGESFLKTLSP